MQGHAAWIYGIVALVLTFLSGTLMEYVIHRLMHKRYFLGKRHAQHHRDGWGQGWLGEFRDYFLPCIPLTLIGFLVSTAVGIGAVVGVVVFTAVAAYSHQIQHENPDLVFWMPRPVHYLHHKYNMWRDNFGITVDWWDRLFGTYKPVEWRREKPIWQHGLRGYLCITWLAFHPNNIQSKR
jgi:sterol desaturase/sphingolipid hydroxylase (fatty acid hydroxylase superfamily)